MKHRLKFGLAIVLVMNIAVPLWAMEDSLTRMSKADDKAQNQKRYFDEEDVVKLPKMSRKKIKMDNASDEADDDQDDEQGHDALNANLEVRKVTVDRTGGTTESKNAMFKPIGNHLQVGTDTSRLDTQSIMTVRASVIHERDWWWERESFANPVDRASTVLGQNEDFFP